MSIKDSWSGEKKRIDYLIIQNYGLCTLLNYVPIYLMLWYGKPQWACQLWWKVGGSELDIHFR